MNQGYGRDGGGFGPQYAGAQSGGDKAVFPELVDLLLGEAAFGSQHQQDFSRGPICRGEVPGERIGFIFIEYDLQIAIIAERLKLEIDSGDMSGEIKEPETKTDPKTD